MYVCMYVCIDEQASQYLLSRLDRHLSMEDSVVCDGPLTMDECATALGQLKPHKSPGMDGLTAEFYRQFWPVLRDDLMAVFQTIYHNGYMSLSQRTGIIRLLSRKGDRKDVGNWRPISLLNVDYKIVAKVLANRLKTVLGSIIKPARYLDDLFTTIVLLFGILSSTA